MHIFKQDYQVDKCLFWSQHVYSLPVMIAFSSTQISQRLCLKASSGHSICDHILAFKYLSHSEGLILSKLKLSKSSIVSNYSILTEIYTSVKDNPFNFGIVPWHSV